MRPPVTFTGNPLDRADAVRSDPARLAALWDAGARVLMMEGLEPALAEGALVWGEAQAVVPGEAVFLGLDGAGIGHFAPVPLPDQANTLPPPFNLWQALDGMDGGEIAVYGTARALVGWHARHRFCARCGGSTQLAKGGWQRDCDACGTPHFPRTDPVVIMSVEHDGRLLLGRQPRFPPHRYSALAGFVEPGESIEEAVAREIFEEAGVEVRDVRYVTSQPWPFPSSLMIAAHAFADDPALSIDRSELEDAHWFTRDEVAQAMEARARGEQGAAFDAPSQTAVAWHLLAHWLED